MRFSVTFPIPRGVEERVYSEDDHYEFREGGILMVAVRETNKTYFYAPGQWLKVEADSPGPGIY